MLLGNLLIALVSEKRFEEGDAIIDSIHKYSIRVGKPESYRNALFSAAKKAVNIGNYEKAICYNEELLNQNITDEEKSIIEKQRSTILYNQEVVEGVHELESMFTSLQPGSTDWFEAGHKLSSAYYLINAHEKNATVLIKMYQAINLNGSVGSGYYLWVLNNLWGLSLETESYHDALRYAKENQNYLSGLSDVPDEYIYDALNGVIVAKMRSKTLDGIDSDLESIERYYRRRYGEISSEYATYLHNRGRTYQLQNKLDEAKNTLLRSIAIQNKVEGKPMERTVKYYMEVEQKLEEL